LHDAHVALNVSDLGINALVAKNPLIPRNPERRKIDNDTWNGNANFFLLLGGLGHTHTQPANPKRNGTNRRRTGCYESTFCHRADTSFLS